MSGHNKWSQIKHKKAAADAKRGQIFSKLIKEITVAAKAGGGDPTMNPRLRLAIDRAKAENMPAENIQRAIKKGTGELEGANYEEHTYEGYGPEGVALIVQALTDNKNRTVGEIRSLFARHGGHLAETGSVGWMFEKKGSFHFPPTIHGDTLMEVALEAGADDVIELGPGKGFDVLTAPNDFAQAADLFRDRGLAWQRAEITLLPKTLIRLSAEKAERVFKLIEALEDSDDVQHVYANFDVSDEDLERLAG